MAINEAGGGCGGMMNDDEATATTVTTSVKKSAADDDKAQQGEHEAPVACEVDTAPSVSAPGTVPPSPEDIEAANTYMDECDMVTDDYGASMLGCFSAPALGSYDGTQGLSLFNDVECGPEWDALDVELCGL